MKTLLIIADYNDADYVKDVIKVEDDVFDKFLPLLKAINNFEPYICKHWMGNICIHNWISSREDLGERNIYETYPQFPKEYIDEFIDIFTGGLYTPYDDCTLHTIVEISDVVTGEKYVEWNFNTITERYSTKIKEYIKKRIEIYSYKRPSDGMPLCSIPYKEMNDYENELIKKLDNLWKDYES